MSVQAEWGDPDEASQADGVVKRRVVIEGARDPIPALLWEPAEPRSGALVLIGHGGGGTKDAEPQDRNARGFVLDHGVSAICIDAPGHGEREPHALGRTPEYYGLWADAATMTANASSDWQRVIDAVLEAGRFDAERIGWSGMSMGSMVGIPFLAVEPRIKAAAIGLCGTTGDTPSRSTIGGVLVRSAPLVRIPLIFMLQWNDERFLREGSMQLFDLLGSTDKRMAVHLGAHAEMPDEGRRQARAFLAERLLG